MEIVAWVIVALLALVCSALVWLYRRTRADLLATRAEADQLRDMAKKRVERPNVFSHEVRTPLSLISGAAELLAEETPGPLNDRQREFVSTIGVNAQRVIGLAEDLLVEARIDAQLFELRLEPLDLRALVRQTVRDARRIHTTPIVLESQGAPIGVVADRNLLGQGCVDLVNNACRHAGEDVTITIQVTLGEGEAIVAVSDDGGGMSAEDRDLLFEPFSVGSSERPGTGLGMMITERIVSQHGGRLLVDSIPDRGTTIFFTLPVPERSEPHA